jgi:protein-tyrosine phosphatase
MKATPTGGSHHFDGLSNFRDIGGVRTADGHTLKPGVLFRSDELSRMTERDLAKLEELDIKLICDLRSLQERQRKQPRTAPSKAIQIVNIPLHDQATQDGSRKKLLGFLFGKTGGDRFREFSREYYRHIAFEQTARIREVITLLSNEQHLPAVIHCNAGKDRTGFLAAIIQLLAGVPYDVVMEDYLRTNHHFERRLERFIKVMRVATLFRVSQERMRLILMTHPEFLDEVYGSIIKRHGSIEEYLCEACEISRDTLQRLRKLLLASSSA